MDGKPPLSLKQGDVFYNPPGQAYNTKNASTTAPLRVFGFLVLEKASL